MQRLALVFFVLLFGALSACQCQATCKPTNCSGCCDAAGRCQGGLDPNACGVSGNNCLVCGAGLFCDRGACNLLNGSGGGTGSTGGGSATGGGGTASGGGAATGGGGSATGGGTATGGGGGSTAITCTACTATADCPASSTCAQYAGSDYCAKNCTGNGDCAAGESCTLTVGTDGTQVKVCVPDDGTCGNSGCRTCPSGTTCDPIQGACLSNGTGGGGGSGGGGGTDGGSCGIYDLPSTSSCCHSCTQGSSGCPANGCISGWWCDTTTCLCHSPVNSACAGSDGGVVVSYDGGIGPTGGSVSKLFFAVVGDTRPAIENDTSNYPTAVITKIYQDLAALHPPPQFVIATGDFMFASPSGTEGAAQMALYMGARNNFPNIVFPAMGNHECKGGAATNCAGITTNNYSTFMSNMVVPIGHTTPWYSVPISDTNGQWTANVIVTACNYWNTTQMSWLQTELNKSNTYTFVVRHMPIGSNGPCNTDMDPMLASANYTGLFTGHTHSVYFSSSDKQLVEGVGGAPITGSSSYGYALVEQQSNGTFKVTQYDSTSGNAVSIYTLP